MEETDKNDSIDINFYVLDSDKLVGEIEEMIGEPKYLFKCNAMRRREKNGNLEETKSKTLVSCPEWVMNKFKEKYGSLIAISPYNWETFILPDLEDGDTNDLHVSGLPNDFTIEDRRDFIENRLNSLLQLDKDYEIIFYTRSRQTGSLHNYVKVKFKDHVTDKLRQYAKVLLNHEEVRRIANSYSFITIDDSFDKVEQILGEIPLLLNNDYTCEKGKNEQSHKIFRITFAKNLRDNVRRYAKNLLIKNGYQLFNDLMTMSSCDCYITAIWFNSRKTFNRISNNNTPVQQNHAKVQPLFLGGKLSKYEPLKIPSRIKETTLVKNN